MNSYYEVVGYENRNGISKKSGKPYDIDIIYVIDQATIPADTGYGKRVEVITYNRLINGQLEAIPLVGDHIMPYYSRSGFVTDIVKVEI